MNNKGLDSFFDAEDENFLENLQKAQAKDTEDTETVVTTKGSNLLKDLKLEAKDIDNYAEKQMTFSTLKNNVEMWQFYYDKVKDIDEDVIRDEVDSLDLTIPTINDLELKSCFDAYVRISNAQYMINRHLGNVKIKYKYIFMAQRDFSSQAYVLMPGKTVDDKKSKANDLVFKYSLALIEIESLKEYLEQYIWIIKSRLESLQQIVYAIISERKQNVSWKDEHFSATSNSL